MPFLSGRPSTALQRNEGEKNKDELKAQKGQIAGTKGWMDVWQKQFHHLFFSIVKCEMYPSNNRTRKSRKKG